MITLDDDIVRSISYYDNEERYYKLQCYVERLERMSGISVTNYGFVGSRNGGFNSFVTDLFDYWYNLNPTYHFVMQSKVLNENIYLEVKSFELLKRLLESDRISYTGRYFEFISNLHNAILSACKLYNVNPTSRFRNLILKKYKKNNSIPKQEVIQMAIELITIKAKFKNIVV